MLAFANKGYHLKKNDETAILLRKWFIAEIINLYHGMYDAFSGLFPEWKFPLYKHCPMFWVLTILNLLQKLKTDRYYQFFNHYTYISS